MTILDERPPCRCWPAHTCTTDRCFECREELTALEADRSMGDYLIAENNAEGEDWVPCYHEYLKCNPCALKAAGYRRLPDGTWAAP